VTADREPPRRPPFDPRRVRPGPDESLPPRRGGQGDDDALTVSSLNTLIRAAVCREFPSELKVGGELSNVSRPSGGHVYFTLKDAASEIRCVMWRSDAAKMRFDAADGLEVIATGTLDVYEPRGQYQLYVRRMAPRGVGALELAFRRLKDKLQAQGLFDSARKKPLPALPRRIAVVTSPTGAAIRDILQTILRRFPRVSVFLYPVRVQGDGAAEQIADAIRRINASRESLGGIDVLIVGRGGGSLEDLWAFNEESVARAIAASRIPIVSAVGHEVDFTIADFVADVRAATPTAAAELVVPVLADLLAAIDDRRRQLESAGRRQWERARSRLAVAERCEWFRDPLGRLRQTRQWLDEAAGRLELAVAQCRSAAAAELHARERRLWRVRPEAELQRRRRLLTEQAHRLLSAAGQAHRRAERRLAVARGDLMAASPRRGADQWRLLWGQCRDRLLAGQARYFADRAGRIEVLGDRLGAGSHESILRRGFSITTMVTNRRVVRRARDVRSGDKVQTRTAEGSFTSRVADDRQPELFDDEPA